MARLTIGANAETRHIQTDNSATLSLMRILDDMNERPVERAWLYLTVEEARELRDALDSRLTEDDDPEWHAHVGDQSEGGQELTVAIYDRAALPSDPVVREFLISGRWTSPAEG